VSSSSPFFEHPSPRARASVNHVVVRTSSDFRSIVVFHFLGAGIPPCTVPCPRVTAGLKYTNFGVRVTGSFW